MALNFHLGATTGLTDGTLEVAGDNEGLHLPTKNTAYAVHLRASAGMENAEAITIPAPEGGEVSKNGTTWASSVTFNAGEVGDTNVPVYFRRLEAAGNAFNIVRQPTTPRLAAVTERAKASNGAPIPFIPTVSDITANDCVVAFGTTDPNSDELTYRVWVTTSPTPPTDWSSRADVTSPLTIAGLTANTTYYAHVRAFDGTNAIVGTSASFSTDVTAPAIAGTLAATAGDGQVTLSGPTATDAVGIAKWQYQVNSGTWVDIASTSGTMPSTIVSGLTNGTAYNFAVRALDAVGNASSTKTASATPITSAPVALAGTLSASAVGLNAVLSGITATAGSGKTIARFEARNKLASVSEWSSPSTLMTAWGSPNSLAAPRLVYTLPTVDIYDVQLRAVDSAGGVSDWVSATLTTAYTTLPVNDNFTSLTYGASVDGYNGWWINKTTANLANQFATRGDANGLTGLIVSNNAPASSPATSADTEIRKLVAVDVSTPTYFETKLTMTNKASTACAFRMLSGAAARVAITYVGGLITCYNGSSFVTVKTGLTGAATIRVIPIPGTQTATVIVNGENLGTVTVWRVFDSPISSLVMTMTGAGLTDTVAFNVDDVLIGRV